MDDVAADDRHDGSGAGHGGDLLELLPDHAGDGAGAVAEHQPQVLPAVAAAAQLGLLDEHGLLDLDPVGELAEQHESEVRDGCGRPAPGTARVPCGRGTPTMG